MKKIIFLLASSFVVLFGFIFSNPLLFGACKDRYQFGGRIGCSDKSIDSIGEPFLIFGIALLVVSIGNIFDRNKNNHALTNFAVFWIPLSALLIAITPGTSNTAMPLYFIGREVITWIMAGLFTLMSLIIIAFSFFHKK